MLDSESEYARVREGITEVLKANKVVKAELNVMQAALKHENDLDQDNHCRKDTLKRNLLKTGDELQWQKSKEDQLLHILRERKAQESQAEEMYVQLESDDAHTNLKLNSAEPEVLYHRKMLGFLEHDVPAAKREVDTLINAKN
jgi:chromosome segregation ATPase